jgi:hypothetical protein
MHLKNVLLFHYGNIACCVPGDAQSPVLLMEQIAILRETMLKQCDEVRVLRHELDEKNSEVEAVSIMLIWRCLAHPCFVTDITGTGWLILLSNCDCQLKITVIHL